MIVEPGTVLLTAALNGAVQFLIWVWLRRTIERRDQEVDNLNGEIKDLRDDRIVKIETGQKEDAARRKEIYVRMENIELNWMRRDECRDSHKQLVAQSTSFTDAVLKLERVKAQIEQTLKWLDDVSKEQISLGKDLSALAARVEELKS